MKPLTNLALIKERLAKVNSKLPAKPIKGHGFERHEILTNRVYGLLCIHCPQHCEVVTSREPINRFGKLGFAGHNYVSPELYAVYKANEADFVKLESALRLTADFGL